MRTTTLFIALGLMACSSDKETATDTADATADEESDADTDTDTDADADADADADTDCNVDIDDIAPENNEDDVFYRSNIEVLLDGSDLTASISVEDEDGNPIGGEVQIDDEVVRFVPIPSLTPDSEHNMTFTWCGGKEQTSFETSELGVPLESDITGQTFALDLASATWVEPPGIGDMVSGYLDMSLLVGVQSIDGDVIDFIGAMGSEGSDSQDMCMPTIDFEPGDFSNAPDYKVGPADLPISAMGATATIFGMEVSGTIASDGDWMGGVELKGSFDIAEIGPILGEAVGFDLSDPDVACGTIAMLGIECQECPHKEEVHCLSLHLTDIVANGTGEAIVEVSEAYCDDACDERDEHPECDGEEDLDTGL